MFSGTEFYLKTGAENAGMRLRHSEEGDAVR